VLTGRERKTDRSEKYDITAEMLGDVFETMFILALTLSSYLRNTWGDRLRNSES
jgi:hypothetical protein